jgi:flagellar basal-body rod protein FlgC
MSGLLNSLSVSASGLTAQRTRLDVTSSNIANIQTTRGPDGGPYKRMDPVFASVDLGGGVAGVEVEAVEADQSAPRQVFDPAHPDANEDGYVAMPNINLVEEMVNMITAQRAYEANASAIDITKKMAHSAISIGDS